jgi:hypothetical protein
VTGALKFMSCLSFFLSTTLWPAWKRGSERGWVSERGPVSERGRAGERDREGGRQRGGGGGVGRALGFRVQSLGFRVLGGDGGWVGRASGFRVQGLGFRVQGLGLGEVPACHLDGMTLGCVEGVRTLSGGHHSQKSVP